MHEFGIAENIFNTLNEVKKNENVKKIFTVKIKSGALLHIVKETLIFAFENIVKDTEFHDVKLEITVEENLMKCIDCGNEEKFDKEKFNCSKCNSENLKLVGSKELIIESIEAE